MATIPEALAIAVEHHNAGRLGEAEQIYSQILAIEPGHAQATHLLGLIALQTGKPEVAIDFIGRAIELDGTESTAYCNLGTALQAVGRLDEAVWCFRRAVERNPHFAAAYNNLGAVFQQQEKRGEAIACFRRALEL